MAKIRAAVDARTDHDLTILARTDAIAVKGLSEAVERAHLCVEAGADWVFNCAAKVGDWGTLSDFRRLNVEALRLLLDAAVPARLERFVHGIGDSPFDQRCQTRRLGFAVECAHPFVHGRNAHSEVGGGRSWRQAARKQLNQVKLSRSESG